MKFLKLREVFRKGVLKYFDSLMKHLNISE